MIRKFRVKGLTNSVELDLNDFNKFLLTNPSGLGIALTNEYIKILNKRINIHQEKDYKPITATIEVTGKNRDDWEWNYNELRDFVVANKKDGFALYYSTIEGYERYVVCDIKLLAKTEKSSYAILVPVEFEIKSNWLEDRIVSVEVSSGDEKGLGFYKETIDSEDYYCYGFLKDEIGEEIEYNYKFIKGLRGEAELINNSDDVTPLKIIITSPCLYPFIRLYDANGNVVQSAKINVSIQEGEQLVINSDPENLEVYLITKQKEKISCIDMLDLSHDGFINLPVGSYTLQISDETENAISGAVNFSLQYLGG